MEHCKVFLNLPEDDRPDYFMKHREDITRNMRSYLKTMDQKYHYYMVTFTLKDEMKEEYDSAESYISSQFTSRPALSIVEAHISQEFTKKGVHHWHVAVKTKKPLCKNRFNYYQKIYGNIDISKTKCQNLQESLNYISKDIIPKQLI